VSLVTKVKAKASAIRLPGKKRSGAPEVPPGRSLRPEDVVRWGPVWGRRVGQFLDHVVWNTRILGAEKVPRTGPVILAANHTGVIDGPVLHGASPRGSYIIVKQEMFKGFLGVVLKYSGQIPVDRRSGRAALTAALALLEEGRVVGIFPEGTRGSGKVSTAQAGIAWLAVRSGAPVVPVAILGTRPSGEHVGHVPPFRTRLHVVFGEPFEAAPPDAGTGREALGTAMERIQTIMSAHVHAAARRTGVPFPDEEVDDEGAVEAVAAAIPPPVETVVGHDVRVERRIAAPPSAVWAVLTDIAAAEQTLSGVTKVELLTEGPYAVGTRWRETRRMAGKEETEEMWVTEVEPERRTVVEASSRGARYITVFDLNPAGSGTLLEVTFGARTVDPNRFERALWSVFGRLGAQVTRKALEQDLQDIAAAARARAGSR